MTVTLIKMTVVLMLLNGHSIGINCLLSLFLIDRKAIYCGEQFLPASVTS